VAELSGLPVWLKWPNDVLVATPDGGLGKCAGLLAESDHSVGVVVIGVGINVGMSQTELPVPTATSLLLAGAGAVSRTDLLGRALAGIQAMFDLWLGGWSEPILARYRRMCATVGQDVTVDTPSGRLAGHCCDIGAGGELVLDVGGVSRHLVAGDVTHVRPGVRVADGDA
jgi:BirA family biotin operon repressor/biotin-[acetyl-CoA-carboxylase] ligase